MSPNDTFHPRMQAASLPALAGWHWSRQGLALFLRQPLAMFTWAMAISLALMLASATPPIGPLIFVALMPVITVMTLAACRHVAAGRLMTPGMWTEPLKRPGTFKRLTGLGALYVALSLLAGLAAFLPYMEEISVAFGAALENDPTPLLLAMRAPMLIFGLLYVGIATLFWYAPALIAFHGTRLSQALFFSVIACWRNKWAFLVYGLVWGAAFMAIDLFATLLVAIGLPPAWAATLRIPLNVALGGALYCSFYPNYATVFGVDGAGQELDDGVGPQA